MRTLAVACLKIAFTVLLSSVGAFACQPCLSTLTLEQSASKAQLIIVGERLNFSPNEVRPQSIEVRVVSVLKGKVQRKKIRVRSWYQICPYELWASIWMGAIGMRLIAAQPMGPVAAFMTPVSGNESE